LAWSAEPANFTPDLGYHAAGQLMYFPAGIPIVLLVALIVYTSKKEAQLKSSNVSKPRA
jgi:hypothetical protein